MAQLRKLTSKQWGKLRQLVFLAKTEAARQKAQERFEKLRMQHWQKGNPTPDPIGTWREELHCSGCGTCQILRSVYLPPAEPMEIKIGPRCDGVFNGRPRGRCGWPTTRTWAFVPDNAL